ncbi:class I SAM-dependent methyltransferase [Vibrio europaeus]|uniref:Methyltransferase n=1 Tax=Vibrio europaeus TaxID=300876 RepID=A0A178J841_9VIBR|nr:class I SAM-dependent methyltransferase [Vibrio europaeus]MDC5705445.1 class I SAM-dependent methyltransferase [Vibrio europaeus]MDC5710724.1 class I SAM-dependent methyltransferase [Vibrio europaeus]MDC5715814.1 class I SAM-dependent methyltransferase [Vibrio europaeus]MDC5719975.1 class I SAM-dependent methyltransferase [Vibrio europaeus]MDC5724138.1 class I SAM-dependent methyltransferase [Vibrio europaeus]
MVQENKDPFNALEAKTEAQKLSFAPIVFQTARTLRDLGVLSALDKAGEKGLNAIEIAQQTQVSEYGVKVLLDMAISANIVLWEKPNYCLANLGFFILHDGMTNANMDFTADVCYAAMMHLTESIVEGKPAGLKELGDWETIYQGLSTLPEQAKESWFKFDHFYSDRSFPVLLEEVFKSQPKTLVDIGGNTGKWAMQCCNYNQDVEITIVDLPQQLEMAMKNAKDQGFASRVHPHPANMLDKQQVLPESADVWWMSQFLDCFSPMEILNILKKVKGQLREGDSIYILELFWDAQKYDAASFSLNATSLYFTCLANGNSRFYRSDDFLEIIEAAGLAVEERTDNIGLGHTLLKLKSQ